MSDSLSDMIAAIHADDTAAASAALERDAALRAVLDKPIPGDDFGTPLVLRLAREGRLAMIDVLLHHGADINARSVWWAGSFGVLDTCAPGLAPALIERGARVDANAAARLGMLDTLVELLDADPALVHARGGDGQTPLHVAANVDIARELVKRGADIDALDVDHESTPAQYLVREHQDVARYLVTRGCRTDILMAAALGSLELVQKHIAANPASLRMRVSPEWFPMRNPRAGGTIYIWTLGLGVSPHSVARDFGHEDIYDYLMSQSPDDLKLVRAAQSGDAALVHQLIGTRAADFAESLGDEDRQGIVVAAARGNTDVVRVMLEAGWPTDVRGEAGGTPLHWAAWLGCAEMARELAKHGAALEDRGDHFGMAPLGWAFHGSLNSWRKDQGDYAATVRVLLEEGALAPDVAAVQGSEAALAALRNFPTREPPAAPPS